MNRESLTRIACDAIESETDGQLLNAGWNLVQLSRAVLDAVLPQITKPEQLAEIPELSLLVGTGGNGESHVFERDSQDGNELFSLYDAKWVHPDVALAGYGPLTVVWRP